MAEHILDHLHESVLETSSTFDHLEDCVELVEARLVSYLLRPCFPVPILNALAAFFDARLSVTV